MLTKELSAAERVQPRFIEPMYAEPGPPAQLPEGNIWLYRQARRLSMSGCEKTRPPTRTRERELDAKDHYQRQYCWLIDLDTMWRADSEANS